MSFLEKARQAAEQARLSATGGGTTAPVTAQPDGAPAAGGYEPTGFSNIGNQLRDAAGQAKKGFVTAVERIDPGVLADIIIKATAIQESANKALRTRGSAYRIGEITITATIPPQIGFAITRISDEELEELRSSPVESVDLVDAADVGDQEIVSLASGADAMADDDPSDAAAPPNVG